jgi:hypothetical protein
MGAYRVELVEIADSLCRGIDVSSMTLLTRGVEQCGGSSLPFYVLRSNLGGRARTLVLCPVCRNYGWLVVRARTGYGKKYRIIHRGKSGCSISFSSSEYEVIDRIHCLAQQSLKRKQASGQRGRTRRKRGRSSRSRNLSRCR